VDESSAGHDVHRSEPDLRASGVAACVEQWSGEETEVFWLVAAVIDGIAGRIHWEVVPDRE